ncbi:MAG: FAD-binding protein [Brevibacillus sp.]|nr:FAD-binding protein [Brevibacillus sp.]
MGSGAAGLSAAVHAAVGGAKVLVIDKGMVGRSGSTVSAVQSAAAGKWSSPEDSVEAYYNDIIVSGKGLSNPELVRTFVQYLERLIDQLVSWGFKIDSDANGSVLRTDASGHAWNRSISAGKGHTGLALLKTLIRQANQLSNIAVLPFTMCVRLHVHRDQISGALVFDLIENRFLFIRCKSLILAAGGAGQLYQVTTNPVQSTADGFALALKANVSLIDMEQVQFYPTSLAVPHFVKGYCLSFYHLSKLYNSRKERFMQKYDPVKLENVPRDAICYAIAREIMENRGSANGGLFLDATEHVDKVKAAFPHEYRFLQKVGIDLAADQVEVAPAAHFMMGGALINSSAMSNIEQLYVIGETAGGLHGGNRLANNALPECLVFGAIAAESASRYAAAAKSYNDMDEKELIAAVHRYGSIICGNGAGQQRSTRPYEFKKQLQQTMTKHASILRERNGLLKAEKHLRSLTEDFEHIAVMGFPNKLSRDIQEMFEAENMLLTSRAIIAAALAREETRGAHVRLDFPNRSPTLSRMVIQHVGGTLHVERQSLRGVQLDEGDGGQVGG